MSDDRAGRYLRGILMGASIARPPRQAPRCANLIRSE
eukprot:CAMPEP_0181052388 /NCGR_PEP_ID=MMETSP1070-20121207/17564_1 /TAXON_ID=265543 /ORGANISM="Minutocellus polymorphus, Strain NH13" /LENGTH=36 /DNA_ID= /DNA_START= /DNA_END= /DNA_ORIENTATION=